MRRFGRSAIAASLLLIRSSLIPRDHPPIAARHGDLDAAPTEIHHQPPLVREIDAVGDRDPDQARLVTAGDGLEVDARLAPDPVHQPAPVAGLPDSARRHRPVMGDPQVVETATHPHESGDRLRLPESIAEAAPSAIPPGGTALLLDAIAWRHQAHPTYLARETLSARRRARRYPTETE